MANKDLQPTVDEGQKMSLPFVIPPLPNDQDQPSPFTPTFGRVPPVLADRQPLINDFAYALDAGPGSQGRATLVTGQRGVGKSVMLKVFRDVAASRQWISVHSDALPGFIRRIGESRIPEAIDQLDSASSTKTRLTGVNLPFGGGGLSTKTETTNPIVRDFEHQLNRVARMLSEHGTGLLITLDEVHKAQLSEMRQFTSTIASAFSEGAPVAFAAAGLPETINALVNDDISTYLQRSAKVELGSLSDEGVRTGLLAPIEDNGKRISADTLNRAAQATGGYPYLVQLIGDQTWKLGSGRVDISDADVSGAIDQSRGMMFEQIHVPNFSRLSGRENEFMTAMSVDEGDSLLRNIADRMGVTSKSAGVFRVRLLAQGVIEAPARGRLRYAIPFTREYLRTRPN